MNKNYYAIIPATVRYDKEIPPNAKLLYGEITALTNERGYCWATNAYFSELYGVSKQSISTWINKLKAAGHITVEITYKKGSKEIQDRRIRIHEYPIQENQDTPHQENPIENNTDILITTSNNKKEKTAKADPPDYALKISRTIIEQSKPNPDKAEIIKGAEAIDKINKLDGHPVQEIIATIDWAMAHPFWRPRILSPVRLREKRRIMQGKEWITDTNTKFDNIHAQWKARQKTTADDRIEQFRKRSEPSCY